MNGQVRAFMIKNWTKTIIWGGVLTAFIIFVIWDLTYNNATYTMRCINYIVNLVSNVARFMERWAKQLFGSYRYQF